MIEDKIAIDSARMMLKASLKHMDQALAGYKVSTDSEKPASMLAFDLIFSMSLANAALGVLNRRSAVNQEQLC